MAQHAWVKLHMICGTATHVVAHAKVSPEADCPVLPELIEKAKVHFRLKEVSADKAYLANYNVKAIVDAGATPFIAFKSNSVGEAGKNPLWRKMYAHFSLRSEDYLNHYHRRSNAETVFDMIKAKFNGSVRSKLATAQVNEVLCRPPSTPLRPTWWCWRASCVSSRRASPRTMQGGCSISTPRCCRPSRGCTRMSAPSMRVAMRLGPPCIS
jgi:hypothetical protein